MRYKLVKQWGGRKAGAFIEVLKPGENPRPGAVDALKAETLKELGYFAVKDERKRRTK